MFFFALSISDKKKHDLQYRYLEVRLLCVHVSTFMLYLNDQERFSKCLFHPWEPPFLHSKVWSYVNLQWGLLVCVCIVRQWVKTEKTSVVDQLPLFFSTSSSTAMENGPTGCHGSLQQCISILVLERTEVNLKKKRITLMQGWGARPLPRKVSVLLPCASVCDLSVSL